MKKFTVWVTHEYTYEIPIEAENAAEAHNLAAVISPEDRKQYTVKSEVRMSTREDSAPL